MRLTETTALRSYSDEAIATTWKPVDLTCAEENGDGAEVVVRTKLVRDMNSAAVCVSEAIAHSILTTLGLRTATAYSVNVGAMLAEGLTAQHDFDPGVIAGRHWGTALIEGSPTVVAADDYGMLAREEDVFLIYLADVLCAYPDRQTEGNVLFVSCPGGTRFDIVPIDQSDCFGHPHCLQDAEALFSLRDDSVARSFQATEQLVVRMGRNRLDAAFDHVKSLGDSILESVSAPADEWYDRARVDPGYVRDFLAYRLDNLHALGKYDFWRSRLDILLELGGDYVILS